MFQLTKNGTEIYSLTEKVTDKDIPKASKFYFQLQPYNIQQVLVFFENNYTRDVKKSVYFYCRVDTF